MKYVYSFEETKDINDNKKLGKNDSYISDMVDLGLCVPYGFIITTDACNQYYIDNEKINIEVQAQINEYIKRLEKLTSKKFGNINNPLLLSIKCGAPIGMPNVMPSILNVGLTECIVENISKNNKQFIWIWESYLYFIKNYAKIKEINLETFTDIEYALKTNKTKLTIDNLRIFANRLKEEYKIKTKNNFPDDSMKQLNSIINASFKSWNNQILKLYREDMDIPFNTGMAINIQTMVFGNLNKKSGVGTIYSRDPITGENELRINFTSESLKYIDNKYSSFNEQSNFVIEFQDVYSELNDICKLLENYYEDMVRINFVIENNKLYIIEVSKGKRSAYAALKIACDFLEDKKKKKILK